MLKRGSMIYPTIGHLKSDHRMERNYLKAKTGDKVNALMSAIGYNFMKLMRALFLSFQVLGLLLQGRSLQSAHTQKSYGTLNCRGLF